MLRCGRFDFTLERPLVMGIVNVTPDSFSDGGQHFTSQQAIEHALALKSAGADLLDIGGESTRPGASPVSESEEIDRILPVIEGLRGEDIALSVDTMKPVVMRAALSAGADMINDVSALTAPEALAIVSGSQAGVCLMHMQGAPRTMQAHPSYQDVVGEVRSFLSGRLAATDAAGIARERVLIDPGFGFGKSLEHNIALFNHLSDFAAMGNLLVGVSRKSMLGAITGRNVGQRQAASIAAALLAAVRGAAVVRVHDVSETVDAFRVWRVMGEGI